MCQKMKTKIKAKWSPIEEEEAAGQIFWWKPKQKGDDRPLEEVFEWSPAKTKEDNGEDSQVLQWDQW